MIFSKFTSVIALALAISTTTLPLLPARAQLFPDSSPNYPFNYNQNIIPRGTQIPVMCQHPALK
jgi:hypothetical protein